MELISTGVFLIWWLAVPHYPWVMLGPAAKVIAFSPAWHTLYVPVTMPIVVSFLMQVVALVHPQWHRVGRYRRLIASALTVVAILLLLRAGDLVVPTGAVPVEPRAIALLNRGVVMTLSLTLVGVLVQIAVDAWRLARRRSLATRAMTV